MTLRQHQKWFVGPRRRRPSAEWEAFWERHHAHRWVTLATNRGGVYLYLRDSALIEVPRRQSPQSDTEEGSGLEKQAAP